jgi:hypothetical protein
MNVLRNGLKLGTLLGLLALFPAVHAYAAGPGKSAYSVAKGDCLWDIAARKDVFGDPWKWPLLFEANRGRINDPDFIQPGWRLKVPLTFSAAEVELAVAYARAYGETVATELPALAAPPAALPAPMEALPPGAGPGPGRPPTWALVAVVSLVGLAILLVLFVGVMAYQWLRDQEPEEPKAVHAEEAPMAMREPASPVAPVEPSVPVAMAGTPAPMAAAEPSGPVAEMAQPAPAAVEAPTPSGPEGIHQEDHPDTLGTESEANLRADESPDPMHPEDHRHAA